MKTHHTITASNLKSHTGRFLRAVGRGKSLLVTHRSKAVARLVPAGAVPAPVRDDDPIFRLSELAEPMGACTNEQMDQLVYGG